MEDVRRSKVSMTVLPDKSQSTTKSLTTFKSQGNLSTSRLKLRRPSYGFHGVPGIKPVERTSQIAIEFKRPMLLYFNTYQLDPHVRFNPEYVLKAANEILDEMFTEHKYSPQESPLLAMKIAGSLMRRVKALNFNRYRIISVVTLAQKRAQSYNNAISFLWDHERDGYINVQREVNTAFIQVTLFGVYLD